MYGRVLELGIQSGLKNHCPTGIGGPNPPTPTIKYEFKVKKRYQFNKNEPLNYM